MAQPHQIEPGHHDERDPSGQAASSPRSDALLPLTVFMTAQRHALLAELMARCAQFGIDASEGELLGAGLLQLAEKTETALEVAVLQSLRADRSFAPRKSRRR